MSTLFVILVLLGFGLWLAAAIPGSRVAEFWARLSFFLAACVWALPVIAGGGL